MKVDISAPMENMACCMTSNLWEIEPFPDNRTRRPTREVEEFPPKEVYSPYSIYKSVTALSTVLLLAVGYTCMSRIAMDCPRISYVLYLTPCDSLWQSWTYLC